MTHQGVFEGPNNFCKQSSVQLTVPSFLLTPEEYLAKSTTALDGDVTTEQRAALPTGTLTHCTRIQIDCILRRAVKNLDKERLLLATPCKQWLYKAEGRRSVWVCQDGDLTALCVHSGTACWRLLYVRFLVASCIDYRYNLLRRFVVLLCCEGKIGMTQFVTGIWERNWTEECHLCRAEGRGIYLYWNVWKSRNGQKFWTAREKAAYTAVAKRTARTELRNMEVLWRTAERIKPKWARKRKERLII